MISNYSKYESRPRLLDLQDHNTILEIDQDGNAFFRPSVTHELQFKEIKIAKKNIYDLLQPTFFGLLEDLVPGSDLSEKFLEEFDVFQKAFDGSLYNIEYGQWVYYPAVTHLVRFAPQFWHRLSLLTRNSILIRDPKMELGWAEIRECFDKATIAVAGVSIGNNAIHAVMQDVRPKRIKIADQKNYHMSNANRVRLTYQDFGKNKAVLTSEQIHSIDPFAAISVFKDGIYGNILKDFVCGNSDLAEPASSVIIEEMDDLDMKIAIREEARRQRIPVVMASDLASAVQLDIRRFDKDANLPLAGCGVSDGELYSALNDCKKAAPGKSRFDIFASRLIGINYRKIPEFRRIFLNEEPRIFGGWAQLGSTAMMGGAIIGETVARIILGHKLPERVFINKFTGESVIEGVRL